MNIYISKNKFFNTIGNLSSYKLSKKVGLSPNTILYNIHKIQNSEEVSPLFIKRISEYFKKDYLYFIDIKKTFLEVKNASNR